MLLPILGRVGEIGLFYYFTQAEAVHAPLWVEMF